MREDAARLVRVQGNIVPREVAAEVGLTRQRLRDAMAELEEAGYAERKPIGDGGLRKGNVQLLCWTVPRPPRR